MAIKEGIRTGGRSARIQESIHAAIRDLLLEHERSILSVPMIAARAGVTPSTIYRRWGDLTSLLADAAVERLRPDVPVNCGNLRDDLQSWTEQYLDDMNSLAGREMMRDVVGSATSCSSKCASIVRDQLQIIVDRAIARGEASPPAEELVDAIVAPMIYRILYAEAAPSLERMFQLIDICLVRHR
ncbi:MULTISPECIES: TetR/AcrR family transcriptional regulator C-terminal ligand-binding domain-containing protein [unclassified Pseudomonas]|uniref:TetR/AcrR family transcriptional regulator n=1 Tax=unclassified Pseudomonas TaxID=196821 RepID=UPI002AC9C12B|nr:MULTISPECIES: TetR/AcrR family transcriptional regulator C-terminal ligand-binding domain-containing protein [unclassified Pseudomonas]MEB0041337.1 TetR/AcrR family transcriptional regulator C-terminal ligand-binding domain-containing protein [Pseudomonas sp. MH10]MEB0076259.1 TetR/AcrR family transcriptional regulator C-terminal ligand-binding domain-containing protein [Pseudomonas sp. MH10out]MEB0090754.1 TetR/AcrR family transcriptional regulator C-terminal ligand-binding domain-containing